MHVRRNALSRKASISGAASAFAALAIPRYPAGAAEFSYKMGGVEPLTHPMGLRAQQACDKILQESGGRLEVKFFPDYQLGSDSSMLTQLRAGGLEFETIADHIFSELIPVVGISSIPFVFTGYKEARTTMDGALGRYVHDVIRKNNFHVFEKKWESSFRQIANNVRPISTPDDLKGIRLRVPPTTLEVACFKAFGASPTPISANEAYVALQTHLVDGIEVPLIAIESFKFYEVSKFASITNHEWQAYNIIGNVDAWARLPKNLQDIVAKNLDAQQPLLRADVERDDARLVAALTGRGMTFNNADVPSFRAAVRTAGLYAQWRPTFGPDAWALLEKSVGKLG